MSSFQGKSLRRKYTSAELEEYQTQLMTVDRGVGNVIGKAHVTDNTDLDFGDLKDRDGKFKSLEGLWDGVDHIALVVSDVCLSNYFYTNVIGFKQAARPDFDSQGAWLWMGNLQLHLIKGTPAVHRPDHLVVSHIAFGVKPG